MKTKCHNPIHWAVTLFAVLYFCQPGLLARACLPNPTNHYPHAVSVDKAIIVQTADESQPPEPPPHKDVIAPLIFFIIVLAVFSWVIYQLIKLMDKIIPPPEKKPDPPPAWSATNGPPITINPISGPGPIVSDLKQSLTVTSNTPAWGKIQTYDIAALGYKDTIEVSVGAYERFWSAGMQWTTNLIDWNDSHYRVDCYINSGYGAVQYAYFFHGTNFWNAYFTSAYVASNHVAPVWFDLSDGPRKPNQFFRLDPK